MLEQKRRDSSEIITRFICICAVAFMVAACQIIEKNSITNIVPDDPVKTAFSPLNDARIAHHEVVEMAGARVADAAPRFTGTSIFKSSDDAISDVSTPFTRIEIRNPSVKLTLTDEDGKHLIFDSTEQSVKDPLLRRPLPIPPIRRHSLSNWSLFDSTEARTWIGNITASWHNEDVRDFLTNGYWMRLDGDLAEGSVTNADIGAFVHGPELSETPELPTTGTIIYRGYASGMYASFYGPLWGSLDPRLVDGLKETGEFTGIIALKADFAKGTIEGCLGCVENLETTGATVDPGGNRNELYTNVSLASIKFPPVPIRQAMFQGTNMAVVIGDQRLGINFETLDNQGSWGGKFSDRLAAGTLGVRFAQPDGSRSAFVGSFFATKVITQ